MSTDCKDIEKKSTKKKLFLKTIIKRDLLLLALLLFSIIINGQSSPDFTILADKAFQKLYQNPDDCISYSQSLLISDQNIEHKIVLQNIISQAYAMKGDYVQSVNISSQKENSEKEGLSYFMQMFGDYSLADQYQNLNLYHQSQEIISNLLSDSKLFTKSENPKVKITIAKLYQLQAINFGINRNYVSALENLKKSDQFITPQNEENKITGLENNIFKSSYLMRQNKLEEAEKLLEKTIYTIENQNNNSSLHALAYENMSRYFFLKQDYNTSIQHLEKGLLKIESLPYNGLKIKIYESLAKSYLALHNDEKYHYYNKLYMDLRTKLDSNAKEGIRYIVKLVENHQTQNLEFQKQNESKKLWSLVTVTFVVIIGLMIYFFIETRRNKDLQKQIDFFEKQKKWEQIIHIAVPEETEEQVIIIDKTLEKDSNKISKEKEGEILQKLEEWEHSDRYLNKNMSLSMLSAQMGVNTKYLSEVINNNKGKNFNGYINELRINHIAHLLKTDSTYLSYKVSYLAEFSGFSSHSAFTTVFKSVTGMSPNVYIQEISKNRLS
ncbi:helix-turn-helix domain-containing protein [Chryseobacterium sp. ERMR1:04]|uniref:helix-turn-helix domain-containing protein n=1 Tax=Chryseobacterium sp. ERMR1:04 TaxID=1705393 RepID=UPI0006C8A7D4|nr:helix-turn-helix domain-containing protein [Chryseobacterium sp. ERMR1:04]KPH10871.1 AraC family transcriptional regulator [Chryseobacterium sp. ERMR1:04]